MIEVFCDAWDLFDSDDKNILCITTNGFIKKDGSNVMGAGIAKECKQRYSGIEYTFGNLIKENGNIVQPIENRILAFPVKHFWYQNADIELIKESCKQLRAIALFNKDKKFILPRPGCGNGKLNWSYVKEIIKDFLPENIIILHFKEDK